MKKYIIILAIFLLVPLSASAATYYVSNSGTDSNNGTSESTPWKTISKVNAQTFQPGDNILFKRGDTWTETLRPKSSGTQGSPITFSAYGDTNSPKPLITGLTAISSWSNLGEGKYKSEVPISFDTEQALYEADNTYVLVTIDGQQREMAKYPKTGFLTYTPVDNNSFNDTSQNDKNWTGTEEAVVRKAQWAWVRSKITGQTGSKISTLENYYFESPGQNNWGYFLQNSPQFLTSFGDWYYDKSSNPQTLQMYFGSENPSQHSVKISTLDKIVDIYNKSYITIDGMALEGARGSIVYAEGANNITVKNSEISFSAKVGLRAYKTPYFTALNNNIKEVNDIAIYVKGPYVKGPNAAPSTNSVIRDNTLTNINYLFGMLNSDPEFHDAGIFINNDNSVVENNYLYNVGGVGISVGHASNVSVKNNFMDTVVTRLSDFGGIYVGDADIAGGMPTNRTVDGNIIINAVGFGEAQSNTQNQAHGVYVDSNTDGVDVINNTVIGCSGYGLFMNNWNDNKVKSNTASDCSSQLTMSSWGAYPSNWIRYST